MPDTHINRLKVAVSGTPGTGTITVSTAASGFRGFVAGDDGKTFSCLFLDGTAWEVATGCTYTHSGTTLSRGTLEASSTGSAISLTSAATVSVIAPASLGNRMEQLSIASGKTLTASNTLTFTGTDSSSVAFGTGGTVAYTGGNLAQFAATSSSQLAGVISDETGSGSLVFATSPSLTTPTLGVASATSINKVALTAPATAATLTIADGKTLTANASLTLAGTDGTTHTFPSTSATVARTDAAQTFTGAQTVQAAATQDAVSLSGRAGGTGSYVATITPTTLSASRTVTLPNADTTVPVASQVLTFSGPTAARTITLPDASFTVARTDAAQTFTGAQTFATSIIVNGSSSGAITIQGAAAAGTYSLTLPTSDGDANQVLTTDGSGVLSWATPSSGGTKTYCTFTPLDNQPPATNFATLDTRNSIAVLDFDAATAEGAVFVGVIPQGATLTSGIKARIFWAATSATSGDVRWSVEFEKYGTDIDSDSFDTATTATTTTSGTSGIVVVTEITATAIDSLAAGDQFRVRIKRDAANAADTMTGDAELVAVEIQQVA